MTSSTMIPSRMVTILASSLAFLLAACGGTDTKYEYPEDSGRKGTNEFYAKEDTLFGSDGINIFGEDDPANNNTGGGGIAVNSFLWRASLDTIAFLPLVSADPFGGVIITDWYTSPSSPGERVKMQVYILDRQLRSDGLRVAVFREQLLEGKWTTQPVSKRTAEAIEDSILSRARELRVKSNA